MERSEVNVRRSETRDGDGMGKGGRGGGLCKCHRAGPRLRGR